MAWSSHKRVLFFNEEKNGVFELGTCGGRTSGNKRKQNRDGNDSTKKDELRIGMKDC